MSQLAVIYARYSSEKQTEQSIEGQLRDCRDFAERNGYEVIAEYIDRAYSGTNDTRPDFQRMLADSAKRQFQYVIVWQLDRFARNTYDSAVNKKILKDNGVKVISAKENITDEPAGIMLESLLVGMAEYFSAELSVKVKRGLRESALKCKTVGGNKMLGYKVNSETKKFEIDEEGAAAVRIVFERYIQGDTMKDITSYLNSLNFKNSQGNPFDINAIRRILTNRRYTGVYIFKDMEIPGGMPQIISLETFNEAQKRIEKNRKAPAHAKADNEYLLTTKLYCGNCKASMFGVSGTSKNGKIHRYYQCINNKRKTCNKKNVSKEWIENAVVQIAKDILTPDNIELIANEVIALIEKDNISDTAKILTKKIKDCDRRKNNLIEALKQGKMTDMLFEEIEKLDNEKKEYEKQLAAEGLKNLTNITKPQIIFFLTELAKSEINNIKYRRRLIDTFINKIYVYDDKNNKDKMKMTILFNSQDSHFELECDINEIESSFNSHLAGETRLEHATNGFGDHYSTIELLP